MVFYGKGEGAKRLRSAAEMVWRWVVSVTNNPGLRGIPLKISWETHTFLSFWCIFSIKIAIWGVPKMGNPILTLWKPYVSILNGFKFGSLGVQPALFLWIALHSIQKALPAGRFPVKLSNKLQSFLCPSLPCASELWWPQHNLGFLTPISMFIQW